MKVHTYHEPIPALDDPPLLRLWARSWSLAGFEPVVLTRSDAERHPQFADLARLRSYFTQNSPCSPAYQLATIARWAAFGMVNEPYVLAADWDVFNLNFRWQSEIEITHYEGPTTNLVAFGPARHNFVCPACTYSSTRVAGRVFEHLLRVAADGVPRGVCHDEDILSADAGPIRIVRVLECPNRTDWHADPVRKPRLVHFSNGSTPSPRSVTVQAELDL